MKIFVGADHKGFELKEKLVELLGHAGYEAVGVGDDHLDPNDDFPVFAAKVVNAIKTSGDPDARGILICGSGQGICMAANRFKGIRAALGYDRQSARVSRNDDDSNVLCLPADVLKSDEAEVIVQTWLDTPFAAPQRFIRRIKELDELG
jgi:ribose 5-phosphate isomerase B